MNKTSSVEIPDNDSNDDAEEVELEVKEQYEMRYNYIWLKEMRGEQKIELIRTLNNSDNLELFEQEVIKIIIDYKWNTYAKWFFVKKFLSYFMFMCFYVYDLETLNT